MKKLVPFLLTAGALLASATAGAAPQANVYASALKAADGKIQFVLNDAATKVVFNLVKDGNVVESVDLGAGAKGLNTVDVPALTSAAGTYCWSLTVSAPAVTEATLLTDGTQENIQIGAAKGVAVDFTPASPYFGNVYLSAPGKPSYNGARGGYGVFAFNAALETINEEPYHGGIAWGEESTSSPNNIAVGDNGDVFVCDWSDGNAGVWIMNPGTPETFAPVFAAGETAASGLVSINGVNVHGSVQACAVYGSGAGRMLYTDDEDLNSNNGEIFVYAIGELSSPWNKAPTAAWGNCDGKLANGNQRVVSDRRGGVWTSQYRWNESEANMCLMHCSSQGVWDFTTGDKSIFLGSTPCGAMGVNADGSLVAVAGNQDGRSFTVARVSYDEAGVPSLSEYCKDVPFQNYGKRPFNVAFDAADNLYIQFNNDGAEGGLAVWALPKEKNEYTTAANGTVEVGNAGLKNTVIANSMRVEGGVIVADNAVRVFTATGILVAEGNAVSTSALGRGLYIATDGVSTIKIVK